MLELSSEESLFRFTNKRESLFAQKKYHQILFAHTLSEASQWGRYSSFFTVLVGLFCPNVSLKLGLLSYSNLLLGLNFLHSYDPFVVRVREAQFRSHSLFLMSNIRSSSHVPSHSWSFLYLDAALRLNGLQLLSLELCDAFFLVSPQKYENAALFPPFNDQNSQDSGKRYWKVSGFDSEKHTNGLVGRQQHFISFTQNRNSV